MNDQNVLAKMARSRGLRRIAMRLVTALGAGLLAGCTTMGIPAKGDVPLATVDLERIYGGWYIVGTIPNFLERGVVGGYDVYGPGWNGGIREDFYMRRGGFHKRQQHYTVAIDVLPNTGNADWRVKPIWPLRLPFQVVYVDPDYRYVLFGEQNRKWGWIYSRTQQVSDADYQMLLSRFAALGWDTSLFRKVVQTPDQIGAPGFWSDGIKPSPAG